MTEQGINRAEYDALMKTPEWHRIQDGNPPPGVYTVIINSFVSPDTAWIRNGFRFDGSHWRTPKGMETNRQVLAWHRDQTDAQTNPEEKQTESLEEFIAIRNAALLAGGAKWIEYCEKHRDPGTPLPSKEIMEISLHKCRVHWLGCPPALLKESVWWLLRRNLHLDM